MLKITPCFLPLLLLCTISLPLTGCKKSTAPKKSTTAKTTAPTSPAKPTAPKKRPAPPKRTSLEGRWVVQLLQMPHGQYPQWGPLGMIEIAKRATVAPEKTNPPKIKSTPTLPILAPKPTTVKKQSPYTVQLLFNPQWKIVSFEITHQTAQITLSTPQRPTITIRVRQKESYAHGSYTMSSRHCLPARFTATNQKKMTGFERPEPPALFEQIAKELHEQKDSPEKFRQFIEKFIKQHPRNAFSFFAQRLLFPKVGEKLTSAEEKRLTTELPQFIKQLSCWGPYLQQITRINYARLLVEQRQQISLVKQLLKETRAQLSTVEIPPILIEDIKFLEKILFIEEHLVNLSSNKKEQQKTAKITLKKVLEEQPFHPLKPLILNALAINAERKNHLDEAIKYYAILVAMPAFSAELRINLMKKSTEDFSEKDETALRKTLEKLWQKKHGNLDKLNAFIKTTYLKTIDSFIPKELKSKPPTSNQRTVLCEFFLSESSYRSIFPELALTAINRTYQPADVIILRHHLDRPENQPKPLQLMNANDTKNPDALINNDSRTRAFNCRVLNLPFLLINGQFIPVNGYTATAQTKLIYQRIQQEIDRQFAKKTALPKITLNASREKDKITVNVNAVAKGLTDDVRLHVVLAESEIHYKAANNTRYHNMIVREMLNGIDGTKPIEKEPTADKTKEEKPTIAKKPNSITPKTWTFSGTFSIDQLKKLQLKFLAGYEKRVNTKIPIKPAAFKKLHIVAFLQNIRTKEVLQTVIKPLN